MASALAYPENRHKVKLKEIKMQIKQVREVGNLHRRINNSETPKKECSNKESNLHLLLSKTRKTLVKQ